MNCNQVQDMLADYLGEELATADRRTLEDHLAECERCAAQVESLQAAIRALRQLGPPPAHAVPHPPPAARTPVLRLQRYLFRPFAYAAMLMIGVGIGWSARPAPPAPTLAPTPGAKSPLVAPAIEEQVRPDNLSPFVRNAYALSRAFSQPTRQ